MVIYSSSCKQWELWIITEYWLKMESVAASILKRAVDMDQKERYTMAKILYEEGLGVLLESIKGTVTLICNLILWIVEIKYFYGRIERSRKEKMFSR